MAVSVDVLRDAADKLIRAGYGTVVLRGAVAPRVWAKSVRDRVIADVSARQVHWAHAGIRGDVLDDAHPNIANPAPLPPAPSAVPPPPLPGTEILAAAPPTGDRGHSQVAAGARPLHQVESQIRPRKLSAAAVLARKVGDPLLFDGTIDGLRGVPVADLAACHGAVGEHMTAAGIPTVYELLTRVPLRHLDRTRLVDIRDAQSGMSQVPIVANVWSTERINRPGQGRKARGGGHARIVITDRAGRHRIVCMFFNAGWQANRFTRGDQVLVLGDVTVWGDKNIVQMQSPLIEPFDPESAAPMMPIYPQSEKHRVTTWQIGRAAVEALRRIDNLDDPLPPIVLDTLRLPGRLAALRAVHVPESETSATAGRDRLAFDELLRLQLALGVRRNGQRALPAVTHRPTGKLVDAYIAGLPWALTAAQSRAVKEIHDDLTAAAPMNRLLQGDVGSGKTECLTLAALAAIESGQQVALVAPTEVLAVQHYQGIATALASHGIHVGLMANMVRTVERRRTLAALADGSMPMVIGTHALFGDDVIFKSLGLVIVDEQHRFGVAQRASMIGKGPGGATPDLLVATATPIPRTAALTAFGDLDITVLDELPPGRTPIGTSATAHADMTDSGDPVWRQVREQVAAGRQAYVVCPLVEESETAQAAAAEQTAEALRAGALSGLRAAVATGRQPAAERAAVMDAFAREQLDVLVATTVIEVGVNVPNATIIVILDAPRFGLAQLHQLRGRVGRGEHPGSCVLVGEATTDVGTQRIDAMVAITSGFTLSEVDMQIRGPGALAGVAQAGKQIGMTVADLLRDTDLMVKARDHARTILAADPQLRRRPTLRHEIEAALGDDAEWLLHA